jgi:hypothetical protein
VGTESATVAPSRASKPPPRFIAYTVPRACWEGPTTSWNAFEALNPVVEALATLLAMSS